MNFERLPNELLCAVFDYLHAIDLFHTFYGLNERFNQLLIQFPAHHVDFRGVSRVHCTHFCRQYLPRILPEVHSLYLSNGDSTAGLAEDFIAHGFTLDQFVQLRTLILESISSVTTANQMMFQYTHLSHLTILRLIDCKDAYADGLLNRIWSLSSLKSYTAPFTTIFNEPLIEELTNVSSSIERLALTDTKLKLHAVVHILHHTPELRQLILSMYQGARLATIDTPSQHLISLNLNYSGESTEALIALFRQMPTLRRVKLDIFDLYVSGRELEKTVVTYLPRLEYFQLNMQFQPLRSDNWEEVADKALSTFQSSFWTEEKKWFVRREWSSDEHQYYMRLSTISYSLDEYMVENYDQSKSTLTEHQPPLSSAVRVTNLRCFDCNSNPSRPLTRSFSHVRHIATAISCCDALLALIPQLDQLSSLTFYVAPRDEHNAQFQIILDRAIRLRRLMFYESSYFVMKILGMRSKSLRELLIHEVPSKARAFNREQCVTMATSPLVQQCELLEVATEALDCLVELLNRLPNLHVLKFECSENSDASRLFGSDGTELLDWLGNHFPTVLWHVHKPYDSVLVGGWIRWSTRHLSFSSVFHCCEVQNKKKEKAGKWTDHLWLHHFESLSFFVDDRVSVP